MTDISKATVIRIISEVRDNAPEVNDNGGTRDGWEMACKEIEKAIAAIESQWEYRSATGDWHPCRSMADAMIWAEDGREIRLSKA